MKRLKIKEGDNYNRNTSPYYSELPGNIIIGEETFTKKSTGKVERWILEKNDIYDVNRYN